MKHSPIDPFEREPCAKSRRILMLLENESYPDDTRVALEARSLVECGFDVTVICPTGVSRTFSESVDGVRVYRYPKPREFEGFFGYVWEYGYSLSATFVLSLYVLFRQGFDVVHLHAPPDMFVLISAFYKILGKRFVLDQHDLSPELYQAQHQGKANRFILFALYCFERVACRLADRLIATNETQRRVQIERNGVSATRCHVVRNGPDAKFLREYEPHDSLRAEDRIVIGYVGMLGFQDGVDYLLRSLASLAADFEQANFSAVIVGCGPALECLQSLAEELGLASQVRFTGYQTGDSLLRYIASFDICVTPDPSNLYNDSCTTVKTMEYMAMAKAVVAFDLPENRVTLADTALYARGNDVRHFAQHLSSLIDKPSERERLGALGRRRVVDHFMWEQQEGTLIDLYGELFSEKYVFSHMHGYQPRATIRPAAKPTITADARVESEQSLSHTL